MGAAASVQTKEESIRCALKGLPDALDTAAYMFERHALVLDPTGNAERFCKYNGALIAVDGKECTAETLRKTLVACMQAGNLLTLSFGDREPDIARLAEDKNFSESLRSCMLRPQCFDEKVWSALLRPEVDGVSAREFRHRIKDAFKIVVCTRKTDVQECPGFHIIHIGDATAAATETDDTPSSDGDTAFFGLKLPKLPNSSDMAEAAFDGEIDEVRQLLEKGFAVDSVEENDHTALSEAAAQNHVEIVELLLEKGADPNTDASKGDRRTPLYRAAFNGHIETCKILLEAGADPDYVCEITNETPVDVCSESEDVQTLLLEWDRELTKTAKQKRADKIRTEREKLIKTAFEREALATRECTERLVALCRDGDLDGLRDAIVEECSSACAESRALRGSLSKTRDARGNSLLSIAAWKGHADIVSSILDRSLLGDQTSENEEDDDDERRLLRQASRPPKIDSRDQRGWTPLHVATFHKHKKVMQLLLKHGANPLLKNAYGKDAFDLAKLARPPGAGDVTLMRWYDPELHKKDLERLEAHKSEIESVLEAWRAESEAFAKTLGAEEAAKKMTTKSASASGDSKKETSTTTTPTAKKKKKKKKRKKKKKQVG